MEEKRFASSTTAFETVDSAYISSHVNGDKVRVGSKGDMQIAYPFILLKTDAIVSYMATILKGIVRGKTLVKNPDLDLYNLYLNVDGQVIDIGQVESRYLRLFLQDKAYQNFKVSVALSDSEVYEGEIVNALCPTSISEEGYK